LTLSLRLLLAWRLTRVVVHVLGGMVRSGLLFPRLGPLARADHTRRWSRRLMAICGVRVVAADGVTAAPSAAMLERVMVVSNHVSWLDIFVINSLYPCRFVAKAEIRAWPMLGWLAGRAGTIFISRGDRRDLRRLFEGLVSKLAGGERIAFFPEGTTAAQGRLLPFHANLFEAAIDAGVPVQPLALSYVDATGAPHAAVDFIGDMTFAASLVGILSGPPVTARLACLAPLPTAGQHRRELAEAAHAAVAGALGIPPTPH
jgi:1-acyl-sn-glycerol-3-phosphate acyltransferase